MRDPLQGAPAAKLPLRVRPPPHPLQNLSTFVNTWVEPEAEELMRRVRAPACQACAAAQAGCMPVPGATGPLPWESNRQTAWPSAAQALPYNMADAVQYPSAAEMEKRWMGLWEGAGWGRERQQRRCLPMAGWLPAAETAQMPCCHCPLQVRELPGAPVELPRRQLCGDR